MRKLFLNQYSPLAVLLNNSVFYFFMVSLSMFDKEVT